MIINLRIEFEYYDYVESWWVRHIWIYHRSIIIYWLYYEYLFMNLQIQDVLTISPQMFDKLIHLLSIMIHLKNIPTIIPSFSTISILYLYFLCFFLTLFLIILSLALNSSFLFLILIIYLLIILSILSIYFLSSSLITTYFEILLLCYLVSNSLLLKIN